jgi:hypothetical protein
MICIIALVVFAVLGLFSVKYRNYFLEALDCVARRAILRKCTTSFDKKMKHKIVAKTSLLNKKLGGLVFKHFELISWAITLLMFASIIWTAYLAFFGLYNFFVFGNCNGPASRNACVYNEIAASAPDLWCLLADNWVWIVGGAAVVLAVVWFLFLRKK